MHVLEAEDHFGRVEANLFLKEDPVLRQVVVEVASVHQVKDETQFLGRLECVRHTHDERTALLEETNIRGQG